MDELSAAAIAGDKEALALVLEQYHTRLRAHAASILPSVDMVDDAMQDLAERALLRVTSISVASWKYETLGPWLFRVLHNLCIDTLRRENTRGHDPLLEDTATEAGDYDVVLSVRSTLESMAPSYRETLTLCYLCGFSNAQAALYRGTTLKSAKSARWRAQQQFRRLWNVGSVSD